ncbi:MAG: O-antigen ligase family protein [Clostridiales bacterium]|nr:O-antigen ligase family protein [Clostridiales bacterium]
MYLYLALGVMFLVLSSKECDVLMLFSLVSFGNIVSIAPNYSVSLSWVFSIVFIIKYFFGKFKIYKGSFVLYLLFAAYMVMGLKPGLEGFLSDIKTIINYLLLLLLIYECKNTDHNKAFDFYIVGHLLSIILSFPVRISPRFAPLISQAFTETSVFNALRFTGIDFDTNFFSANCAFIISILLFYFANRSRDDFPLRRMRIVLLIYIVFGILTFSKTFMIDLLVIVLVYFSSNLSRKFANMILTVVLVVVGFYIVDTVTNGMLFNAIFGRFFETATNIDTLTTGRFHIWKAYMDDWKSSSHNIWFGVGMANKKLRYLNKMHHQTYIEILYQFGIVGSILFTLYVVSLFRIGKDEDKAFDSHSRFLGLISIAMCGLTLGQFAFDHTIFQLVLSILMVGGCMWKDQMSYIGHRMD